MGKLAFDPLQNIIISNFIKDPYLRKTFYFTGGTALSVYYLQHRLSEDLDFFTENNFPPQKIIDFISTLSTKHHFSFKLRQPEGIDILIFSLDFGRGKTLKIDFNRYPYKRIEKGKIIDGLTIDSKRDIATNKLLTINQRTDAKDFVDLYFLLREFTVWDLIYGVEAKFRMEMDPLLIASDFLKVEEFDFLPKMLVPLKIKDLILFFRNQAKEIGKRITT